MEDNRQGYSSFMGRRGQQGLDTHTGNRDGNNVFKKRQVFIDAIEESWQEKIIL
jgi:hypothetical protein